MRTFLKNITAVMALLLLCSMPAVADGGLKLTFSRGASMDNSIVSVKNADGTVPTGVTASISCNAASWLTTSVAAADSILCPNQNTNSLTVDNPLTFTIVINGLSKGYSFDSIAVENLALNSAGLAQDAGQTRLRRMEIVTAFSVSQDTQSFLLESTNINAGAAKGDPTITALKGSSVELKSSGESLYITLKISQSDTNGCFFGLSGISLATASSTVEDPKPIEQDYYTFTTYNGGLYLMEDNGGNLTFGEYSVSSKCFWELIPTDKANCYYVRNAVSKRYIQSTVAAGNNGTVQMGTNPVEYCVAENASVGAGFCYLVSTDNAGYASPSAANLGLNKGGSSVVAYASATANKNSYWKKAKTSLLYEIKPFNTAETLGAHSYNYLISSVDGKCLETSADEVTLSEKTKALSQQWYFVGQSNASGYKIASNLDVNTTLNLVSGKLVASQTSEPTLWTVYEGENDASMFYFRSLPSAGVGATTLAIGSDSLFAFFGVRNAYAAKMQIYQLPCGVTGDTYISSAAVSGEDVLKTLSYSASSAPSSWYLLFVNDKGGVAKGKDFSLDLSLSKVPDASTDVFVYFDWNKDGDFETMYNLSAAKDMQQLVSVPADAITGKTRMRVRLTSNSLSDPEADVAGQTIDFILYVDEAQEGKTVAVSANSDYRGTASLSSVADVYAYGAQLTATATPLGVSSFISWTEGKKVVSTDAQYSFIVDHNVNLVANFTPNIEGGDLLSIDSSVKSENFVYELNKKNGSITVNTDLKVTKMALYTPDGKLVKESNGNVLKYSGLQEGTYIVKIFTVKASGSDKIYIK